MIPATTPSGSPGDRPTTIPPLGPTLPAPAPPAEAQAAAPRKRPAPSQDTVPRGRRRGWLTTALCHGFLVAFSVAVLLPVVYVVKKAFTPGQEFATSLDPRIPL